MPQAKTARKHPDVLYEFADEHIEWLRDRKRMGKTVADELHAKRYTDLYTRAAEVLKEYPRFKHCLLYTSPSPRD